MFLVCFVGFFVCFSRLHVTAEMQKGMAETARALNETDQGSSLCSTSYMLWASVLTSQSLPLVL